MKIAIHSNQFDGRGTGKVPLDYGLGLQNLLGHEVVCITSALSKNEGLEVLSRDFKTFTYNKKAGDNPASEVADAINRIIESEKIDFIHMLKAGENDAIHPTGCKVGVHCVFNMAHPHGDVYAGVSEYLAKKHNQTAYVPHIIKNYPPTKDLRSELGIPKDALVFGRHGGSNTFDIPFVYTAINRILNERKDVYFVFLATTPFMKHDRVIFIPWAVEQQDIFNFIHACDIMIHARGAGETFGLAVGEFSVANKPVITNGGYDKAHVWHLGERAIVYNDEHQLMDIFRQVTREYIQDNDWDVFSQTFSEKTVTEQYKQVFLS